MLNPFSYYLSLITRINLLVPENFAEKCLFKLVSAFSGQNQAKTNQNCPKCSTSTKLKTVDITSSTIENVLSPNNRCSAQVTRS